MKIVFLHDNPPLAGFAGATVSTYDLAVGLQEAGHDVFVITTCRHKSEAIQINWRGLKIFKIATNYPSRWRAYLSLYNPATVRVVARLLKEIRPDVVHVHNIHFYLSYHCLKLAKQYARMVVFTARDVMLFNFGKLQTKRYLDNFDCRTTWRDHFHQAGKRWNPLRNFFIKRYLSYADKIFAVSDALKQALGQNGIGNVEVMHTGAIIDLSSPAEEEVARFREKYRLKNKKIILFSGRLTEAKGGKKALEMLALVVKEIPNSVLLIVGTIDDCALRMQKRADELGIGDKLIFTGWIDRDEIKYVYAAADLVLVPSICFDAFPRVVLEGMAAMKPVIGTCYGGTSELIVDSVTGYVVNPLNISEMAKKTIELLGDQEKMWRFGKAGYERVRQDFNLNLKLKVHLACYKTALVKK